MPAPGELGSGLVRVPEGGDLHLEVLLEDVSDGVLVTASVQAPLAGECARCLDEFTGVAHVQFRELFAAEAGGSGDDGYLLDGDLLDLEPALRDALVLDLPLSPLCSDDCPGLCSTCGIRLADAGPDHGHPDDGGVWAVLKDLFPAEPAGGSGGSSPRASTRDGSGESSPGAGTAGGQAGASRPENGSSSGTPRPAGSKER